MLYSLLSFGLAIATFFMLDMRWYFALPIAFAVLVATGVVRVAYWEILEKTQQRRLGG